MKKRLLSLVLCLVMVFSLFPAFGMNALAADSGTVTLADTQLGVSWYVSYPSNVNYVNGSGTSINASVQGKNQYVTITLTNNSGKDGQLSFDYSGRCKQGKVTVAETTVIEISQDTDTPYGSYTYDEPFAARSSITIRLDGKKNSLMNPYETNINITNIALRRDPSSFSVDATSATVNVDTSTTVGVQNNGCVITATSADPTVAQASYANGQVTITGKAAGTTTITVAGTPDSTHYAPNPNSYTITVTVTDGSGPVNPPTPASTTYADNGANDAQAGSKSVSVIDRDDMYMSKTLTRENDGTYTIELNAYAKETTVTVGGNSQADVVLVLDTTSSMNVPMDKKYVSDLIDQYGSLNVGGLDSKHYPTVEDVIADITDPVTGEIHYGLTPNFDFMDVTGSGLYIYPMYVEQDPNGQTASGEHTGYNFYYYDKDNQKQNAGQITNYEQDPQTYAVTKTNVVAATYKTPMGALKRALDGFLDSVEGQDINVGVVTFAGKTGSENGGAYSGAEKKSYSDANAMSDSALYTYVTKNCKTQFADLKATVRNLTVETVSHTYPGQGFALADKILRGRGESTRDLALLFFTDGEPEGSEAVGSVNSSIDVAKHYKDQNADVYSVGIFGTGTALGGEDHKWSDPYTSQWFLRYVSSNHPTAENLDTATTENPSDVDENAGYYHRVSPDAMNELKDVFVDIAEDVSVPAVQLGTDAILRDVIDTDNFNLANAEVEAKWQIAGTPNWNTANKINTVDNDNLNKETGVLEVTGFNYSEYYIGAGNQWGRQIIVRITGLTLNKENPTYIDPVEVGGVTDAIASNESAGVYKNAEAMTNNSPVISPLIPWTRYTPPEPDPVDSNASDDGGDLKMTKGLYMDPTTGEYSIRMDAWSTGVVKQTDVDLSVPTDIILVIDLSDSMYLRQDVVVDRNEDGTPIMGYRKDALLNALDKFILKLQTEQSKHADNPNYYRLAVVTFAGYYDHHDPTVASSGAQGGTYVFYPTNYDSNSTTNTYLASDKKDQKATVTTQIANASLRPINDACVTAFDSMIHSTDNKQPFGFWRFNGTKPDRGLEYAYDILDKRTDKSKSAAVILFTDGAPGTSSGLQHDGTSDGDGYVNYADDAIKKAHDIKALGAAHDNNIKIFTVGLLSTDPSYKLWVQGNNNRNSEYRIDRAMEFISSDYPDITTISQYGTNEAEQETHRNTDGVEYYTRVGTGSDNVSTALETALGAAMTTVVSGYSGATVGFDDKLTDTIDLSNFDLPDDFSEEANVEVYAVPALGFNTDGSIIWDNSNKVKVGDDPIVKGSDTVIDFNGEDAVTVTGNKVEVSGFDYSKLYTAQGSGDPILGYKLVVKINGLLPKHGGNDIQSNADTETAFAAGVYSEDGTPAVTVKSPVIDIDSQPYVIDFNVKMNLTSVGENAKIVNFANRERVNSLSGTNGDFSIASNNLYYQLKYNNDGTSLTSGNAAGLVMASSDSAMIYDGAAWKEHIAIPASSVYFDDDLLEAKTVDVGDGSGRNAGVSNGSADPLTAGEYTFKFNGSAIDIYGTTNADGGYIVGTLCSVNPDGSIGDRVTEVKNEMMKVHSVTPRNNVPVISIDAPSYNTYYLKLKVVATSNFSLDGIRVYGSVNDQTTYDKTTEKYAAYINLRKALLNDSYAAVDGSSTVDITTGAVAPGALFVDDVSKLTVQVPDLDKDGKEQHDEAGNVIMKDAWQTSVQKYAANSPKNEVYLAYENQPYSTGQVDENGKPVMSQYASNQSLVFTLTGTALQGKIWIGLSAPDEDSMDTGKTRQVTVTVNGEDHTIPVDNQLDQYYELEKDWLGTGSGSKVVTITNSGNTMISVTNLKITGVQSIYNAANDITSAYDDNGDPAAIVESFEDVMDLVFEPVTVHTLRVAQNKGVDPDAVIVPAEPDTPDEPDTPVVPGIREMLRELISSFVSSLFTSIGRLFGH